MSRSTYPYDPSHPGLRTCRHGTPHCVHVNSMCIWHPRTCLTCCMSVQGRDCAIRVVPDDEVKDAWRRLGAAARETADAFRRLGEAVEQPELSEEAAQARMKSDMEALYGTEEERR